MKNYFLPLIARTTAVCGGIALFLSLLGAYNTDQFGWPWVWVYWFGLLFIGWGLSLLVFDPIAYRILIGRPWLMRWALGSAALTLPMIGMVMVAQTIMGEPIPASALAPFALQVGAVTFGVCAVSMLAGPWAGGPREASVGKAQPDQTSPMVDRGGPPPAAGQPASSPAFARRLPAKLMGAEIWALSAEDHYVRVHSSKGADLVLIRFADAIAEMEGVEGVRVHRSWWVARAGVTQLRKRTEGGVAVLKSGVEAPISRSAMPGVVRRAWV